MDIEGCPSLRQKLVRPKNASLKEERRNYYERVELSSRYDLGKICETRRSVISQQFLYHTSENLCVDLRIC